MWKEAVAAVELSGPFADWRNLLVYNRAIKIPQKQLLVTEFDSRIPERRGHLRFLRCPCDALFGCVPPAKHKLLKICNATLDKAGTVAVRLEA